MFQRKQNSDFQDLHILGNEMLKLVYCKQGLETPACSYALDCRKL